MSQSFVSVPNTPHYSIVNARVSVDLAPSLAGHAASDGFVDCAIAVQDGRIAAIEPVQPKGSETLSPTSGHGPAIDLCGGIVLPRFVDPHTHLDKGHIWARTPNPDGSFLGARSAVMADREAYWSADDVRARMDFALRCAFAHGTGAIRTHLDSIGKQTAITWPVFDEVRAAWRGRIALQAVALFPVEIAVDDEAQFRGIVGTVARYGGALGGLTFLGEPPGAKLDLALDRVFDAAIAHGLDLDFHVDESNSPHARTLEPIALAALRHRFTGRIVAGHCCSLALASDEDRARIIDCVGEAGIAVVSLPMCNMYLQDRAPGRTPRWRGVAPLHELDAAGVPVMVASDNTRDPFYAYGDLDMLEVFREATRILQLDHSARPWWRLLGPAPAQAIGFPEHGLIARNAPADFVLTRARTLGELLSRPQADRVVVVQGREVAATSPDYRELDSLTRAAGRP